MVEIGSLVVRSVFADTEQGQDRSVTQDELARLRRTLLADMQELINEYDRRLRER